MAGLSRFPARNCWRVYYTLYLRDKRVRKNKYPKTQAEGQVLLRRIEELEAATRNGIAKLEAIREWIDRKWITEEEAASSFEGFAETEERVRAKRAEQTDYDALRDAYVEYAEERAKPTARVVQRKNISNAISVADRALRFLRKQHPDLNTLDEAAVTDYRRQLQDEGAAPWTVFHILTALRVLVDMAVDRRMVPENLARNVRLRQPKRLKVRRILNHAEIQWALSRSLEFRHVINGGLPTVVRLGLYLGLRPIEMCWFSWDWVDWDRRLVHVGETVCEVTRGKDHMEERWTPKDAELRTLSAKVELLDYLKGERGRQEAAGLLNQFVLPAGNAKQPQFLGRALGQDQPQKAFKKLVEVDEMDPELTAYSFRHTFCTNLLRPSLQELALYS